MRKGIYLFLTVLIVACSGSDDSSDDVSNGATLNVKLYGIDNSDINNPNQEINLNTTLSLIQIGCNFSADFPTLEAFDEVNFGGWLDFWFHIDSSMTEGLYSFESTNDCTTRFESGYESTISPELTLFDGDLIFDLSTEYEFLEGTFEITQVNSNSISYSFYGIAIAYDVFSDEFLGSVVVEMNVVNMPYETE